MLKMYQLFIITPPDPTCFHEISLLEISVNKEENNEFFCVELYMRYKIYI